MRKFLAALMAVFMLTATLAVLPVAAADDITSKDGTVAADADAIDLVVTEVLADTTANNVSMSTKNAYQYIEVYNRGTAPVNLYDYAIVRAAYNQKNKGGEWPDPKKFTGKIVLDELSIYSYYQQNNVAAVNDYVKNPQIACINRGESGELAPGQVALIWIVNAETLEVLQANGGTAGAEAAGTFTNFRNHYAANGAAIPEDVKIVAALGIDGVGQSFSLNTTGNYMYALVEDGDDRG